MILCGGPVAREASLGVAAACGASVQKHSKFELYNYPKKDVLEVGQCIQYEYELKAGCILDPV